MFLKSIKKSLYFPLAYYFRFWAGIRLLRWRPRVIVVTGSSGKTTLLHMLEAQFGNKAIYTHHANSAYGIPFFILDLHRKSFKSIEWLIFFITAPINAIKNPPQEKIFIVEADTDRPGEGKFLAEFLQPEVVLWTSVSRTHSMNFDPTSLKLPTSPMLRWTSRGAGQMNVDEAIAFDFGYFLQYCRKLGIINADLELIKKQEARSKKQIIEVNKKSDLESYELAIDNTIFHIRGAKFLFKAVLPEEIFYSIVMCQEVCGYFKIPFDKKFKHLNLPPGRSSIFKGIKNTTIIDSSYNANLSSMTAVLNMYSKMPGNKKWVVLGDMLELGEKEREEHEKLGEVLTEIDLERIILVGPRVGKYTFPILDQRSKIKDQNHNSKLKNKQSKDITIEKFLNKGKVLDYIKNNIRGGESVLFKASASIYLEEIIENLLADQKDASLLPRRGKFWNMKRG